ncbi:hypothetical protein NVP1188A_16 [Vibrio phage 1.188.A._10N.286.51.A6]|uniref:Uncharacterized protein n=4 Tax=Mukerjeevirus TaxID=2733146 RepID=A0A2I7REG1_9CAUD|nr:hypothetical protein HOU76_gp82 [Vibrio phage 1.169.O._10N.261.52.B1]YP_009817475.1 hypothetical protein HOU77_gp16 [Vibrio phage 1.188.A._10N.286.51.A6]AUR93670.1 hypothetical protein NVP1188B_16 [Vibrio phage 1.188.B._10N.286.51.A6]AUR93756.1 hypothetical protein NVP1188C_16 [Vibrio phage 1.188.C._10N.286.51.A6]AUR92045.1 hypothetical protein NVP1169O_17 [Vibrio phage 1.169.O._10N.261.52.B1]AUR93584.1 hypothetical protein NVP1188A_16 [Vibrio phage 1.188.A._10N.286.51.A6]
MSIFDKPMKALTCEICGSIQDVRIEKTMETMRNKAHCQKCIQALKNTESITAVLPSIPRSTGATGRMLLKAILRASMKPTDHVVVVTHSSDYARTLRQRAGIIIVHCFGRHADQTSHDTLEFAGCKISFKSKTVMERLDTSGLTIFEDNGIAVTEMEKLGKKENLAAPSFKLPPKFKPILNNSFGEDHGTDEEYP